MLPLLLLVVLAVIGCYVAVFAKLAWAQLHTKLLMYTMYAYTNFSYTGAGAPPTHMRMP
jgi:hypothetical protein